MNLKFLTVLIVLGLAGQSEAASVSLSTQVGVQSQAQDDQQTKTETYDTGVDGPLQYITAEAELPPGDIRADALAGVDLTLGASRARARLKKTPNSGPSMAQSVAFTQVQDTFTVSGSGKARVNFTIYGDFASTTDIEFPGSFMSGFGGLQVLHNGAFYQEALSTKDVNDPLFDVSAGPLHRLLSFTFDVADGDTFDVSAVIEAKITFEDLVSAAYDMEVDLKAGLRVFGMDGATVEPTDGSSGVVPLPASALLLMSPLGGLMLLRRRKARRMML